MRVIAGTHRGRHIIGPPGRTTRPTSDRVRESVFGMLYSLGDVVREATVVDLFAGSGAMGLEALSRGAGEAVFVDNDEHALRVVRANLESLSLGPAAVVGGDASCLVSEWVRAGERYDLALLDPPYDYDGWPELLLDLPAQTAVLESDRAIDPPFGWEVVRSKRYGRTHVVIAQRIAV